jgi:hypothetical protein
MLCEVQANQINSLRALGTEIVVAGVAMPDPIVIDGLAFGAAVASVVVTVVLGFDFLNLDCLTFSYIILMRLCLWLQMRQSLHCLYLQDLHSRVAALAQISQNWSVGSTIFYSFLM